MRNIGSILTLIGMAIVMGPLSAVAAEPVAVSVGSPLVRGTVLHPYRNEWRMATVSTTGATRSDVGTWANRLDMIYIGGKRCLQRTQFATFKRKNGSVGATTETINVFDATTLAPISRLFKQHVMSTGQDIIDRVTFAGQSMTIASTANGKTDVKTVRSATPAFDFYGGVYALLWVSLPLKQGFTATFQSYDEQDATKVLRVSYKVTGSATIDDGTGHSRSAWIVECDSAIGPLKYWVSSKAPYILRMDYTDKTTGTLWKLTETG